MGEHLIFVISQPRSGSTLLQHIVGSHSQVHTLPEPWFMLHLIYGLRPSGLEAEYNARFAYLALKDFLDRIPEGKGTYIKAIRGMALDLYQKALEPSGKKYFLDKTPRYYFIIHELHRIFPKAKFIFLIRNPVAVLSSILEVNFRGNWMGLSEVDRKHDILSAPRLIIEGIKEFGERAAVVHYEQLVVEPEGVVRDLCQKIGLNFETDMLNYGSKIKFEDTTFVDSESIYKHQYPVRDYLDRWITRFDTPQKIHIAKAYLTTLGKDTIKNLGYSYDDIMKKLNAIRTNRKQVIVSWELLVTPLEKLPWWSRIRFAIVSSLQKRGVWGTLRHCAGFILRGR